MEDSETVETDFELADGPSVLEEGPYGEAGESSEDEVLMKAAIHLSLQHTGVASATASSSKTRLGSIDRSVLKRAQTVEHRLARVSNLTRKKLIQQGSNDSKTEEDIIDSDDYLGPDNPNDEGAAEEDSASEWEDDLASTKASVKQKGTAKARNGKTANKSSSAKSLNILEMQLSESEGEGEEGDEKEEEIFMTVHDQLAKQRRERKRFLSDRRALKQEEKVLVRELGRKLTWVPISSVLSTSQSGWFLFLSGRKVFLGAEETSPWAEKRLGRPRSEHCDIWASESETTGKLETEAVTLPTRKFVLDAWARENGLGWWDACSACCFFLRFSC